MEELDGDDIRVSTQKGKVASRDIVQFVPLRKFHNPSTVGGLDSNQTKLNLAKEVLAEIPDQLISYMKMKQIDPLNLSSPRLYPNIDSSSIDNGCAASMTSNEIYSSDDE